MNKDALRQKPYGHHLENLLACAKASGLDAHVSLSAEEVEAITVATPFYNSGPQGRRRFQYFEVSLFLNQKGLPDRTSLASAAKSLVTDSGLEDAYVESA
jgi:hypothetical protein